MTTEKKLTGYPSIDKPQNQFYRKTPIREINDEQTGARIVPGCNGTIGE